MSVETAADRLVFVDTADFAVEASYTPIGGGPSRAITGLFDSAAVAIDVEAEVAVQTRRPQLHCRVDDLDNGGREGDTIAVSVTQLLAAGLDRAAAGTYKVRVVEPDGTGMVMLGLEKQ